MVMKKSVYNWPKGLVKRESSSAHWVLAMNGMTPFLDRLTGLSGGTARLVVSIEDLKQFIRNQVSSLSKVYARNLNLRIEDSPHATLVDMYSEFIQMRLHLPIEQQVRLGNLPFNDRIKVLARI